MPRYYKICFKLEARDVAEAHSVADQLLIRPDGLALKHGITAAGLERLSSEPSGRSNGRTGAPKGGH